jgi:hypothetical protein
VYPCVLQVVQQKPIEAYRNTFANLALPLFAMAEPIPAKAFEYRDLKWSIWDRWILEGDLTVQVRGVGGGCVDTEVRGSCINKQGFVGRRGRGGGGQ